MAGRIGRMPTYAQARAIGEPAVNGNSILTILKSPKRSLRIASIGRRKQSSSRHCRRPVLADRKADELVGAARDCLGARRSEAVSLPRWIISAVGAETRSPAI
jgi:hypothetical protein